MDPWTQALVAPLVPGLGRQGQPVHNHLVFYGWCGANQSSYLHGKCFICGAVALVLCCDFYVQYTGMKYWYYNTEES